MPGVFCAPPTLHTPPAPLLLILRLLLLLLLLPLIKQLLLIILLLLLFVLLLPRLFCISVCRFRPEAQLFAGDIPAPDTEPVVLKLPSLKMLEALLVAVAVTDVDTPLFCTMFDGSMPPLDTCPCICICMVCRAGVVGTESCGDDVTSACN